MNCLYFLVSVSGASDFFFLTHLILCKANAGFGLHNKKTLMSGYFGFFSFRHSETRSFFVWLDLAELVATRFCYVKSAYLYFWPGAVLALCRTVEMPLTPQVFHLLSGARIKRNYGGFSWCFFDQTPRQHESSLWWVITAIDAHTILLRYWTWPTVCLFPGERRRRDLFKHTNE